jgi:hypothetical protein
MFIAGCGQRSGPKSIAISGTVTYRGKAVDDATVIFISPTTRPADGKTDAEGRFQLKAFLAGGESSQQQSVCLTKAAANPRFHGDTSISPKINCLPSRYAAPMQTPLKAAVSLQGPNEFHFNLTD